MHFKGLFMMSVNFSKQQFKRTLLALSTLLLLIICYSLFKWMWSPQSIDFRSQKLWKNGERSSTGKIGEPKSLEPLHSIHFGATIDRETGVLPLHDFKKRIAAEGRRVGRLDPSSEETRLRLLKWSRGLTEDQMEYLSQQVTSTSVDADMRFLSVYLLNENTSSRRYLMNIVNHPIEVDSSKIRVFEQEVLLRAMALEGAFKGKSLSEAQKGLGKFISRQDNTMLIHHARLLLSSMTQKNQFEQ